MSIYMNPILIKLSDSDHFLMLQTYDASHGKSERFYLSKAALSSMIDDKRQSSIIENDLLNFCCCRRCADEIHFKLFWLKGSWSDDLNGYQQSFTVPISKIEAALCNVAIKHLCRSISNEKARISFSSSAHEAIAEIAQDKLKRHALRRFFRDNLNYGSKEHLTIHRDSWVDGFYFQSMNSFDGGIVPHETQVIGRNGKAYCKVYYGIHT